MATPAVAGIAALVRQFLIEGRHEIYSPSAFAASQYNMTRPSSALLKSILVSSTFPLSYGYDSSGSTVTLSDFYDGSSAVADSTAYCLGTPRLDFTQGFGHVRTSNVFDLSGALDTFLYEDTLSEYSTWTKTFAVTSANTNVVVTLVWNDPPGSTWCGYTSGGYTSTCLIHDLDLKVFQGSTQLYSNFGAAAVGDYSGEYDTLNNVEKVTIEAASLTVGETVEVVVETNGLSYFESQKFAVVVTGRLSSLAEGTKPPSLSPTPVPTRDWTLVYELDIPASSEDWNEYVDVGYGRDECLTIGGGKFSKIAYEITLDEDTMWVEFDSFTTDACKVGVPVDWTFDEAITGLTVVASDSTLDRTEEGGYVEFWSHCYETAAGSGRSGASSTT